MASPLTSKLQLNREDGKKGSKKVLKWTPEEVEAFNALKNSLVENLELYQVQPDKPFVMKVDASRYACDAVLEQERDGKLKPVGFFIRKLAQGQQK